MQISEAQTLPAWSICELLLQQSPGCSWVLNRSQEFHLVYGDALCVFGRPAGQLTGLKFTDVLAPEVCLSWCGRVERVLAGDMVCATARIPASSASWSLTLYPVRVPGGGIAFAGGIARKIAERDLVVRLLRAQENDRARISTLLHDHVGQQLSAAGLQLDLLRMDLGETGFPISERTAEIQHMLETVMELVREMNHELNPAFAERIGLRAALDRLAGRLRSDFKGTIRVFADPAAKPPAKTAAALYRIAQEAAGNAVRHSGCSAIEILLKSVRSGPALEIRDNGKGFDVTGGVFRNRGLGLVVMEQYADEAGIDLDIESAPGKGTVVKALCGTAQERGTG
jgi:signal transduction histidine kinase